MICIDNRAIINTDNQIQILEEKRKVFRVEKKDWNDIEYLWRKDIPKGFTLEVLTTFVTTFSATVDGQKIIDSTEKPAQKGRRLYMSYHIKRAWFITTDTKLLVSCNVQSSMKKQIK